MFGTATASRSVAKRLVDLVGSLALLTVTAPLLVLICAAIKLTSPGSVLYRQARAGLDGQPFAMLKFRTMHTGADRLRESLAGLNETDGHLFKVRNDPRITTVGRTLRRLSLDELPQLVNVVRGEMSLVGPRPLPMTDSEYTGHARGRLRVPPGITGLWQVSGRSELSWEEMVRLDLHYVENWSLALDLAILARTVPAVLTSRGAV